MGLRRGWAISAAVTTYHAMQPSTSSATWQDGLACAEPC